MLVVVAAFLDEIAEYFVGGYIDRFHLDIVAIYFEWNLITLKHIFEMHTIGSIEVLKTAGIVGLCRNLARVEQLEQQSEQIHTAFLWLYRVV